MCFCFFVGKCLELSSGWCFLNRASPHFIGTASTNHKEHLIQRPCHDLTWVSTVTPRDGWTAEGSCASVGFYVADELMLGDGFRWGWLVVGEIHPNKLVETFFMQGLGCNLSLFGKKGLCGKKLLGQRHLRILHFWIVYPKNPPRISMDFSLLQFGVKKSWWLSI